MKLTLFTVSLFALSSMVLAYPGNSCATKHVASRRDTCGSIAHNYGISIQELQRWNDNLGGNPRHCKKPTPGRSYCVKLRRGSGHGRDDGRDHGRDHGRDYGRDHDYHKRASGLGEHHKIKPIKGHKPIKHHKPKPLKHNKPKHFKPKKLGHHKREEHGKGSSKDHGKGPSNEHGKEPSKDHGKGPSNEHGKEPSKDHGKGPSNEHGKGPSNEHGKGPSNEHGKGHDEHGKGHDEHGKGHDEHDRHDDHRDDHDNHRRPNTHGLHLAAHTDPNCQRYYVARNDDSCRSIARKNHISENQLYKYNQGLRRRGDHQCANLSPGRAYCVDV